MGKIWDKGYELDRAVERFTVGRDWQLDRALIVADAMGSVGHARMLAQVGLISPAERDALVAELRAIARDGAAGRVEIRPADEDCHTVIEARLIEKTGEAGEKIHTGRSRNDQIATALRLYSREALDLIALRALALIEELFGGAEREAATVMPGRTHLQIAMLSTWGLWLGAWAETLLDDLDELITVTGQVDRSPLGSAASYGVPLPLDREFAARELGFAGVHANTLAVQLARGPMETRITGALGALAATLARMAQDLIIFSLPEVGYVRLPEKLCSGSSIMPQKRNPDVLELMRSHAALFDGWAAQCRGATRSLPSGYNRDLQDTKEPLLRALDTMRDELDVAAVLVGSLEPDRQRMRAALNRELFATDYAYELVRDGVPFRRAYRRAAAEYGDRPVPDPDVALAARTATGSPGQLPHEASLARLEAARATVEQRRVRHREAVERCLGEWIPLSGAGA